MASYVNYVSWIQPLHFPSLPFPFSPQRADLASGKKSDKVMGAQAHKRMMAALQKQIAIQEKKCQEVLKLHVAVEALF